MLDMLSLANHLHQNTQNPTSKNSQTKKHDTAHAWAPTTPEGICSKGGARWLASSLHVHSNQTTTESFQVVELSWSNSRVTVTKLHVVESAHIMFDARSCKIIMVLLDFFSHRLSRVNKLSLDIVSFVSCAPDIVGYRIVRFGSFNYR